MNAQEEKIKRIIDEETKEIKHLIDVQNLNINRILKILKKSQNDSHKVNPVEYLGYLHDIARSAIVFLHATLESTLREIIRIHIENNIDKKLREMDPYKYSLKDTSIITKIFSKLQIPEDTLTKHYKNLDKLMARRHKIVHEADMKRGTTELEEVKIEDVKEWINEVSTFCLEATKLTCKNITVKKIYKRLKTEGINLTKEDIYNSLKFETTTRNNGKVIISS